MKILDDEYFNMHFKGFFSMIFQYVQKINFQRFKRYGHIFKRECMYKIM